MYVRGQTVGCSPSEALYIEDVADRPDRCDEIWEIAREARIAWTNQLVPNLPIEYPPTFNDPRSQFSLRYNLARRLWKAHYADAQPAPIAMEFSERQLRLVKKLTELALQAAEQQAGDVDAHYLEMHKVAGNWPPSSELVRVQEECGITEETIKADLFRQALDEIQMAHTIITAIDAPLV